MSDALADHLQDIIRPWLPQGACLVACRIGSYPFFPGEEAHVAHAVQKRQDEFSAGRHSARAALAGIGVAPCKIGIGRFMQPLWPDHVTGSISHDRDMAVAVCLKKGEVESIGIDIHSVISPSEYDEIETAVLSRDEISAVRKNPSIWPLIFAAKEASIKAVSARAQRIIEMTDITIIGEGSDSFRAYLKPEKIEFWGRWVISKEFAIALSTLMAGNQVP